MNIIYSKTSVQIKDSYLITDKFQQMGIITAIKRCHKCPIEVKNRPNISLYREWKTHNKLYQLGLWKSRTKDVDFNKLKWYINLMYNIVGIFIK